jgi:hypothetical protein
MGWDGRPAAAAGGVVAGFGPRWNLPAPVLALAPPASRGWWAGCWRQSGTGCRLG